MLSQEGFPYQFGIDNFYGYKCRAEIDCQIGRVEGNEILTPIFRLFDMQSGNLIFSITFPTRSNPNMLAWKVGVENGREPYYDYKKIDQFLLKPLANLFNTNCNWASGTYPGERFSLVQKNKPTLAPMPTSTPTKKTRGRLIKKTKPAVELPATLSQPADVAQQPLAPMDFELEHQPKPKKQTSARAKSNTNFSEVPSHPSRFKITRSKNPIASPEPQPPKPAPLVEMPAELPLNSLSSLDGIPLPADDLHSFKQPTFVPETLPALALPAILKPAVLKRTVAGRKVVSAPVVVERARTAPNSLGPDELDFALLPEKKERNTRSSRSRTPIQLTEKKGTPKQAFRLEQSYLSFSDFVSFYQKHLNSCSDSSMHRVLNEMVNLKDQKTKQYFFSYRTGEIYTVGIMLTDNKAIQFKISNLNSSKNLMIDILDNNNQKLFTITIDDNGQASILKHQLSDKQRKIWTPEEVDNLVTQFSNELRLETTVLPFQQVSGKKRSFVDEDGSPSHKKRAPNGTSWKNPLTGEQLETLVREHKDLPMEERYQKVVYDHATKEKRIFSCKEYDVANQHIIWKGLDGKEYKVKACIYETDAMRPQAFPGDSRCTSWFFRMAPNRQPVLPTMPYPSFQSNQASYKLVELRFYQKGQEDEGDELLKDFGTEDQYGKKINLKVDLPVTATGEIAESQFSFEPERKHTAFGEMVGLHSGSGKNAMPGPEVLRLYNAYLPLLGRQMTYSVDASNLEASAQRANSLDSDIDELASLSWKGKVHGVKLGLSSFIEYGKSGYQRSFEKLGHKFSFVSGPFSAAYEGDYNQDNQSRDVAIYQLKSCTLEKWHGLLQKQAHDVLGRINEDTERLKQNMFEIPELKGFIRKKTSLKDPAVLAEIVSIENKQSACNDVLFLCRKYKNYMENKQVPFSREHLLEALGKNTEIMKLVKGRDLGLLLEQRWFDGPMQKIEQRAASKSSELKNAYAVTQLFRAVELLEWERRFPVILEKLAREMIPEFKGFAGSSLTIEQFQKMVKEHSRRKGGMGPSSEFLAFNNLLTYGVDFDLPTPRVPVAANSLEEFRRWVHELTGGSLFFQFETLDTPVQTVSQDKDGYSAGASGLGLDLSPTSGAGAGSGLLDPMKSVAMDDETNSPTSLVAAAFPFA